MSRQPRPVRGATIVGTGMYVPERVLTNFDLEKMVDTSGSSSAPEFASAASRRTTRPRPTWR